jgi:hypothetical protein
MKKLVTSQLGFSLNPKATLLPGYDYYKSWDDSDDAGDLSLCFAACPNGGDSRRMTELDFSRAPKKKREVFIGGSNRQDPSEAIRLISRRYPDATILMRLEPKRKVR